MDNKITDIPLHDIKPLLEIKEYSFYYLLGGSILALLLACGIIFLIYRYVKNRNKFNIRKENLKLLKSINLKDTKKAAYDITFYGASFKDDSPKHLQMYNDLVSRLQDYKYKQEVEPMDKETLEYIQLYKEMCDV